MLTPDYLESVADDAVKLYAELENAIIRDIARRILTAGVMTETARHQIKVMQQSGELYNEIVEEIAKITKQSKQTIKKIFEEASIEALRYDDKVYELAGLNPIPLAQSPNLLQTLTAGMNKTDKDISNLIMTTAKNASNEFVTITNKAYLQVTSGAFDYNTAIFNAVNEISQNGIDVIYPSGKKDKIDVAVRRAVLTGVNQTACKLQDERAEEMNCDLVEVSAHSGARATKKQDWTNHAWWQGKIYSRSGTHSKYPDFKETTGYGKVDGLGGINCRHNFYPFFEGISKRNYTDQELEEINNRKVIYNGKEYGEYDALQMQRKQEREIRKVKRQLAGYEEIKLNGADQEQINEADRKFQSKAYELKKKEKELKNFIEQTGFKRDRARERVAGFDRGFNNRVVRANTEFTRRQKSDIIIEEIKQCGIRGNVNLKPREIDSASLKFDNNHINKERLHDVTEQEAKQFIKEAKISVTIWKGKFENYYGENGATYVNMETKEIRTSFKAEQFTNNIKEMLEVLKKNGR